MHVPIIYRNSRAILQLQAELQAFEVVDRQGGGNLSALETARWSSAASALEMSELTGVQVGSSVLARLFVSAVEALQSAHESTLQPLLVCMR